MFISCGSLPFGSDFSWEATTASRDWPPGPPTCPPVAEGLPDPGKVTPGGEAVDKEAASVVESLAATAARLAAVLVAACTRLTADFDSDSSRIMLLKKKNILLTQKFQDFTLIK